MAKWKGQIALEINEANHMLKLASAFGADANEQHDIIDEIAARAHRLLNQKGDHDALSKIPTANQG